MRTRRLLVFVAAGTVVMSACTSSAKHPTSTSTTSAPPTVSPLRNRPLPHPVAVRRQPQGVTLADPEFEALPGAHAEFGRLRGSVYQVEIPDHWNGRLLLFMHGYGEFARETNAGSPDFRRYLIAHGFAWGASSFSNTSLIPGRAADETAALWDAFVRKHGRPKWSYVSGLSMGGWATNIAAERYGNRFDGALAFCGAVGTAPGLRIAAEFFVAAAYVAAVTQAEFEAAPSVDELIERRIKPALRDPGRHARFEKLLVAMTGGPRAFAREGIHEEEETNWSRAAQLVGAGIAPPRGAPYVLAPGSDTTSEEFNRRAIRLPTDDDALRAFADDLGGGMEVTGNLEMPLVSVHTTGDGQVPIDQAQILHDRVQRAGQSGRLVERVIEDPGHCGFSTGEQEAALQALVDWVERGRKPDGTDVGVVDLEHLDQVFDLRARPGTAAADGAPGAQGRAAVRGRARLDGEAFDARWIGAVVLADDLVTPCQYTLPPIERGRYEITVYGANESAGCGRPGAEIVMWTFVGDEKLYSTAAIPWPRAGTADADVDFSTSDPLGATPPVSEFGGEVYRRDGRHVRPGSRVDAWIGQSRCGVATIRPDGFYILSVVGPDSVPGCRSGARITFRVDGAPTIETRANTPDLQGQTDLTLRGPGARE